MSLITRSRSPLPFQSARTGLLYPPVSPSRGPCDPPQWWPAAGFDFASRRISMFPVRTRSGGARSRTCWSSTGLRTRCRKSGFRGNLGSCHALVLPRPRRRPPSTHIPRHASIAAPRRPAPLPARPRRRVPAPRCAPDRRGRADRAALRGCRDCAREGPRGGARGAAPPHPAAPGPGADSVRQPGPRGADLRAVGPRPRRLGAHRQGGDGTRGDAGRVRALRGSGRCLQEAGRLADRGGPQARGRGDLPGAGRQGACCERLGAGGDVLRPRGRPRSRRVPGAERAAPRRRGPPRGRKRRRGPAPRAPDRRARGRGR